MHRAPLRRSAALAFAGSLLGLASGELDGQSIESPYRFVETRQEAGAFVGTFDPGTGRFGFGPGSGPLLGLRYAIDVSGPFSLEGVASYIPTTRDVVDPGRDEGDRVVGEADMQLTFLEARLKFSLTGQRTWYGLTPYVLAGGGIGFDLAGEQEIDETLAGDDRFEFGTSFLGSVGGGVRWLPTERFELRTDGLLFLYQIDTPPGYESTERGFENVAENEWVNALSLTLGAAIRF